MIIEHFVFSLQIRVVASDGGSPPRIDTTVVSVTVTRNLQKPRFDPQNYPVRVLQTFPIGQVLTTVSAKDNDRRVSSIVNIEVDLRIFKI